MDIKVDTPSPRTHPEAEMAAEVGGSDGRLVRLSVANLCNKETEEVVIHANSTIDDLKRVIQNVFESRPAPQQQRLIFRGKHCEETHHLGHILRGLDLSSQHRMHLVIAQPLHQPSQPQRAFPVNLERAHHPRQLSDRGISFSNQSAQEPPVRIELTSLQVAQLRWQYERALEENHQALATQQKQYEFLTGRFVAVDRQLRNSPVVDEAQPSRQQPVWRPSAAMESEVVTAAATRALGGNMPGPAAGAAVRDVTGPPPEGFIPAAGLDENGQEGRGNLEDPAPRAHDVRREAHEYLKMLLQYLGVVVVFGLDADGWVLLVLMLGGFTAFLFKIGLLEEMLGGGQDGGGIWQALCTAATVITEGGGLLMDLRFICSAFFLSLFPTWKPTRSPEAIAAEAAAREATRAAHATTQEAPRAADAATVEATRATHATTQEAPRAADAATVEAVRAVSTATREEIQAAAARQAARAAEAAKEEKGVSAAIPTGEAGEDEGGLAPSEVD